MASITPTVLPTADLQTAYENILSNLYENQLVYNPITMESKTQQSISNDIASYLRPIYEMAINSRKSQTASTNAAIDVDAASRGLLRSTWVTDVKNRNYATEASDVSNLETQYAAALAEQVYNTYNDYQTQQLNLALQNAANQMEAEKFNVQNQYTLEQEAYNRAVDSKKNGWLGGNTSSSKSSGTSTKTTIGPIPTPIGNS